MLSPYQLWKNDHSPKGQPPRKAVTWGPRGQPYVGEKGSLCFRHPTVDWGVHRLVPAVHSRLKPGGIAQKAVSRASVIGMKNKSDRSHFIKHTQSALLKSSPRWGEGKAPSLHYGKFDGRIHAGLPHANVDIRPHTKVAGGVAAAAATAYEGYQHRGEIEHAATSATHDVSNVKNRIMSLHNRQH